MNRCHIVAAVGDIWHVGVERLPPLLLLRVNGDGGVDDDSRSVGEPSVVAAAAAGRPPLFADWVRYRLMTIFSKNHLLPMFCIVCLRLHIYRYLGLKLKSSP